ncbi:hypothetical protein G7Y89_g1715 [Cudoniella acicularis]|uniref:Uncharacterized protein n=1 Tax=Cudoniella acicularis TaxID=354080 RepID=A0A8H4RXM9_9HELO|nr:hypothetical protein G7Y89_g1715 [Cudoniella acicularis]
MNHPGPPSPTGPHADRPDDPTGLATSNEASSQGQRQPPVSTIPEAPLPPNNRSPATAIPIEVPPNGAPSPAVVPSSSTAPLKSMAAPVDAPAVQAKLSHDQPKNSSVTSTRPIVESRPQVHKNPQKILAGSEVKRNPGAQAQPPKAAPQPRRRPESTNMGQPSRNLSGVGNNGRKTNNQPPAQKPQLICGNCQDIGHEVADCTRNLDSEGFVNACPFHNTNSHSAFRCPDVYDIPLRKLYYFLVRRRAGKPPIRCPWNFWSIDPVRWEAQRDVVRPQRAQFALDRAQKMGWQGIREVVRDPMFDGANWEQFLGTNWILPQVHTQDLALLLAPRGPPPMVYDARHIQHLAVNQSSDTENPRKRSRETFEGDGPVTTREDGESARGPKYHLNAHANASSSFGESAYDSAEVKHERGASQPSPAVKVEDGEISPDETPIIKREKTESPEPGR